MGTGEIIYIDEYFVIEQQTSTGNNMITDGEGEKWRDDDSNGIGNGWSHAAGTGTPAIVTGNGFVGNAQKIEHVNGTTTQFQYNTGITGVIGQTVKLTLKYRLTGGSWQIYARGLANVLINGPAQVTGDAVEITGEVEITGATGLILNIYCVSTEATHSMEIDEVVYAPVIDSFFYEPEVLGLDPVIINTSDLPAYRYLVQYYNITNRKDLILLAAGHSLTADDHKKLMKFTKNS